MVEQDHSAYPEKLLLRENPLAILSISARGTDAARRALAPGQGLGWGGMQPSPGEGGQPAGRARSPLCRSVPVPEQELSGRR